MIRPVDALVISVAFLDAAEAEAFAIQFGGQEPTQIASPLVEEVVSPS
jgi:hypothetical protein